jgi:histidine ammonia-lyase
MDTGIEIDGDHLTIEQVIAVARHQEKVKLSAKARKKLDESHEVVERLLHADKPMYAINTGFGPFRDKRINNSDIEALQTNMMRSHSVGVGNPFPEEIVRAAMLIRANTIAKGYSGARQVVVDTLVDMLNRGVTPFVPEKGSVGASGDLAPLSHVALVMLGEGEAYYNTGKVSGKTAMEKAGIPPITLKAKEGVAVNNGTAFSAAEAAHAVSDSEALMKNALMAASLSFEALKITSRAFDERIHALRPHPGQITAARVVREFTRGSKIIDSMQEKVQDDYSVRCTPQVMGASLDALAYAKGIVETELNSVTDNPILVDNTPISGGNFHGQPLALPMDFLGIALSEVGNIAERRIAKLTNAHHSDGLPPFLIPEEKAGVNSGFMMVQYTAAALVSENKILSHPASVDSIPTSANAEDHVSMSTIAARKANEICENVEHIIGIEFLCAAQGVDLRKDEFSIPRDLGGGTRMVYEAIRQEIPYLEEDRYMYPDLMKIKRMIHDRVLIEKTNSVWRNIYDETHV